MKPAFSAAGLLMAFLISACAPHRTPEESIRVAFSYANLEWEPTADHVRHGPDSHGITVHTPDVSLNKHGDRRGYWIPGKTATGMAYKWGGFDTPMTFLQGLTEGKKAGDVANAYKVRNDDHAVSSESVGIDCSGFVSRCWGLKTHHSTARLPSVSEPIAWDNLRRADIIMKKGHVVLYVDQQGPNIIGFEAGPIPTWRARPCAIPIKYLKFHGYTAYRYKYMAEPKPDAPPATLPSPALSRTQWTTGPY